MIPQFLSSIRQRSLTIGLDLWGRVVRSGTGPRPVLTQIRLRFGKEAMFPELIAESEVKSAQVQKLSSFICEPGDNFSSLTFSP